MHSNTIRICLWSGPRNISTTLMYSFAQRQDTRVFDEPLYAHYLRHTDADTYHPGAEEVLASMENDGQKVIEMMLEMKDRPVVFFKNMTHHLRGLNYDFLKNVTNLILIRNPLEMIPSFGKVIENPTMQDLGYEAQAKLIDYFEKNQIKYIVLDAKNVLLNPESVLTACCDTIGIPFDKSMLQWEKGSRNEDGSWAKYWYKNIHNSTGFKPYQPPAAPFPTRYNDLLKKCQKIYNGMVSKAL